MKYDRPIGCSAALTPNWERIPGGGFLGLDAIKLTVSIRCGDQQSSAEDSFDYRSPQELSFDISRRLSEDIVGEEISTLLDQMCSDCPRNTRQS